ncbi:MAG: MmgE/PrpD family protein [bacterium]
MKQTMQLAARISAANYADMSAAARLASKQALLDFIGVTIAGMEEPLARILRADAADQGGHPQACVFATGERVATQQAALINGAAGHAHDYDDVQLAMSGHPTVPVAPVVFALAEQHNLTGPELIAAFSTGVDAECIISRYAGASHYQQGWHATGTMGCFGAAAAAASMLKLNDFQTATALGIAGTQAAGLKSQFGTMCKPFHAGHAAATGLQAANLAARGFSSRTDILEIEQGFLDTQSNSTDPARFALAMQQQSYVQDICFKYHAACYLTHSAIEATRELCARNAFDPRRIKHVQVAVDEGHLRVCNIAAPVSGLEAKFSLRFTVAMTLAGVDTSSIDIFTDELTRDPQLIAFRDRVWVVTHPSPNPASIVTITTEDNQQFQHATNVGIPMRDLDGQWQKLAHKFRSLVTPRLGLTRTEKIIDLCLHLETLDNLTELFDALTFNVNTSAHE